MADSESVSRAMAVSGWAVAGLLFLVPSCYWLLVHALAVVGFLAVATGKTKDILPSLEDAVQRLAQNSKLGTLAKAQCALLRQSKAPSGSPVSAQASVPTT